MPHAMRLMYTVADAYRLASLASVDYRTALRALNGEQVKGLAGERLRAALVGFQLAKGPRYPDAPEPAAISSVTKPQA